jgi:hypothetical protein
MKTKTPKLVTSMKAEAATPKFTLTENGALTYTTSGTAVLDLFSLGGAIRNRTESDVVEIFKKAYMENKLLALRTIFYLRDVRGGQGERRAFRLAWNWLADNDKKVALKNAKLVPQFGRWDDLLEASVGTQIEDEVFSIAAKQLTADSLEKDDSKLTLCAKWAPSINTSSAKTRSLAKKLSKYMELSEKDYRKMLSKLRSRINIVEKLMTKNKWSKIEYSHVPSRASSIYKNAFKKHDESRYVDWQNKLEKGEAKVNSTTLYPYDIVRDLRRNPSNKTLEAQWKALPNYLAENPSNCLVVADVSGSMTGGGNGNVTPIDVCISLAIYIAERNSGIFKDYFLTFSEDSQLQQLVGDTLTAKIRNLSNANWGMSTNLQSAFDSILSVAVKNKIPAKDMPSSLIIVSDMEFNSCVHGTNYDTIKNKYRNAGYELPNITFWNVNSRNNQSPAKKDDKGVTLVSGCSPSILTQVLSGSSKTPLQFMLDVINAEKYQVVKV